MDVSLGMKLGGAILSRSAAGGMVSGSLIRKLSKNLSLRSISLINRSCVVIVCTMYLKAGVMVEREIERVMTNEE